MSGSFAKRCTWQRLPWVWPPARWVVATPIFLRGLRGRTTTSKLQWGSSCWGVKNEFPLFSKQGGTHMSWLSRLTLGLTILAACAAPVFAAKKAVPEEGAVELMLLRQQSVQKE